MPKAALTAALVVAAAGAAAAQDGAPPTTAELERRLAAQEAELAELREAVARLQAGPTPADDAAPEGPGGDEDPVRLGLFFLESADGADRLELHSRLMLDAFLDPAGRDYYEDSFQVRRARFSVQGRLFRLASFDIDLEVGKDEVQPENLWIGLDPWPELRLRAGQMVLPFSDVRLRSSNRLRHLERPIGVAALVGDRDVGVMLHGALLEGALGYALGAFNGAGEHTQFDSDDDSDLVGRLVLDPTEWLHVSAAYIYTPTDRTSEGPGDLRTVGGERSRFLDYDAANRRRSRRQAAGGGLRLWLGPVELKGEVVADLHEEVLSPTGERDDLLTLSWFVDVVWVLTGEAQGEQVEPASPLYDPGAESWGSGAVEVALRYEEVHADPEVLSAGYAVGTDRVRSATATVTWYALAGARVMGSYTYTDFAHPVADLDGRRHGQDHALTVRLHLWF